MTKKNVDIIVPIYNAYDDLVICLDSVKRHTDLQRHRMILIDDNSPDKRIRSLLESQRSEGAIVILNNQNMGFPYNVNLGIECSSENDVLLLNSDTIVTSGWLEKLIDCAYFEESIATVTPLSNNGSLASIPEFMKSNDIPKGYTIDTFSELVERVSLRKYPTIPVGVGFCLYIRRNAINYIGKFDHITFGKGYGEENDYCYRAIELGFKNVLCDDTFIYHKGSSSFPDEVKLFHMEKNQNILKNKYWHLYNEMVGYTVDNPDSDIWDNIKLHLNLDRTKKNILFLLHIGFDCDSNNSIGGTQYHVQDIIKNVHDYNCFVFFYDNVKNLYVLKSYNQGINVEFGFSIKEKIRLTNFHNSEYKKIISTILKAFNIDLVHVHHTIFHSFDIFYEAKSLGIPVILTLHDYYYICPTYNLLNKNNVYCTEIATFEMCKECLKNKLNFESNILNIWRDKVNEIFSICKEIITPSQSSKDIYCHYYNLHEKIKVIEHGNKGGKSKKTPTRSNNTFNVAFIGVMTPVKGSNVIKEMITHDKAAKIRWHFFGLIFDEELKKLNQPNIKFHGAYSQNEINILLEKNEINLVCILSIWPETYCYTLSESVNSNIPVIVMDLGAIKERTEKIGCGIVVKHDSKAEEILKVIYALAGNSEQYKALIETIRKIELRKIDDMIEDYKKLYFQAFMHQRDKQKFDSRFLLNAYYYLCDKYGNNKYREYVDLANNLQNEIILIKNSVSFRMIQKMQNIRFPFKEKVKKTIKRIVK